MGSYNWKISKRQIILSSILLVAFGILMLLSILLEGKAYYYFARNTLLGTVLYFATVFRYMEEVKIAIVLDIAYLVVFVFMICSVIVSFKKPKIIYIVYAICICDIFLCLLCKNIIGIVGDIFIIILRRNMIKAGQYK